MKYILILIFCIISIQGFPKQVSQEKAKKIADNWAYLKMQRAKGNIKKEYEFVNKYDTSLYVFNFNNGGFVIVSADDHTSPVLGYSMDNQIDIDRLNPILLDWLNYYSDMIKFNKKVPQDKKIKDKWIEIDDVIALKSTQTTVPSLFENTNSSRWAGWRPYFNQAPAAQSQYVEGYNGCVPGAIAAILKYFKYPLIGTGIGSGYNNNTYFTQNLNLFFNYDLMPFRLTYCGNGTNNCNDGSFSIIPGTTQAQIDEVGKIQYMSGLAVGMNWLGMGVPATTSTGTTGTTNDWATEMANHFYYVQPNDADYWSSSEISGNTSGFKNSLRNSLNSGYPSLLKYTTSATGGGHVVVIDGYENDQFFHFSMGWGGDGDAYYYLFKLLICFRQVIIN